MLTLRVIIAFVSYLLLMHEMISSNLEAVTNSRKTMDIIINIQGFKGENESFIPKEVAVLSMDKSLMAHWIIAPTCNFTDLPTIVRLQNNIATINNHGIEWFEGEVPEKHLFANLRELSKQAKIIYSSRQNSVTFLQQVMAREVINLDVLEHRPSFDELPPSNTYCMLHYAKNPLKEYKCALNEVKRLQKWMIAKENAQRACSNNHEQFRNIGYSTDTSSTHIRSLSIGPDSSGVDETCGPCS